MDFCKKLCLPNTPKWLLGTYFRPAFGKEGLLFKKKPLRIRRKDFMAQIGFARSQEARAQPPIKLDYLAKSGGKCQSDIILAPW